MNLKSLLELKQRKAANGAMALDPRTIAELLGTSQMALDAFEEAYRIHALDVEASPEDDVFHANYRQAERMRAGTGHAGETAHESDVDALVGRSASELASLTQVYTYDPDRGCGFMPARALPADCRVTREDVATETGPEGSVSFFFLSPAYPPPIHRSRTYEGTGGHGDAPAGTAGVAQGTL